MPHTRKTLPNVKEIGRELEVLGFVSFGPRAYNQTGANCFDIATYLANRFGYRPPSCGEIVEELNLVNFNRFWGFNVPRKFDYPSEACIVVRTLDNPRAVHVSFELYGHEYNYGPGIGEGFPIQTRIPLVRQ